ncbi:MAG: hypothetical protein FWG80_04875 [Alphaproteobacteria bacterium]|nr:hypothetical protein [Alphaproteobacteria bacterium]
MKTNIKSFLKAKLSIEDKAPATPGIIIYEEKLPKNFELNLENIMKLGLSGGYNPDSHTITVGRVVLHKSQQGNEKLQKVVDAINKNLAEPVDWHEHHHAKTERYRKNLITLGRFDEARVFIHFELSARVAQLLKLRRDFKLGLSDADLEVLNLSYDNEYFKMPYWIWLRKQTKLDKVPSAEEAKELLDGASHLYPWQLINWDILWHYKMPDAIIKRPFIAAKKKIMRKLGVPSRSYDETIERLYDFDIDGENFNLFESLPPERRDKLINGVIKVVSRNLRKPAAFNKAVSKDR